MSEQNGRWGVGRPLGGTTSATKQIYYALAKAGEAGVTVDELIEQLRGQLPSGYVWRTYQAYLTSTQKKNATRRPDTLSRANSEGVKNPTLAERARAERYVVKRALENLTRVDSNGTRAAFRRPDGRFVVGLRVPRAMKGLEGKYDESGEITRKAVTTMELVRVFRPVLEVIKARRAAKRNLPTVSQELASALERWFEAHAVQA